jgi:hypothetical protein
MWTMGSGDPCWCFTGPGSTRSSACLSSCAGNAGLLEHRVVTDSGDPGDDTFRNYFGIKTADLLERYERYVTPGTPLADRAALENDRSNTGSAASVSPRTGWCPDLQGPSATGAAPENQLGSKDPAITQDRGTTTLQTPPRSRVHDAGEPPTRDTLRPTRGMRGRGMRRVGVYSWSSDAVIDDLAAGRRLSIRGRGYTVTTDWSGDGQADLCGDRLA